MKITSIVEPGFRTSDPGQPLRFLTITADLMPEGWTLENREFAEKGDEFVVIYRDTIASNVGDSSVVPMMTAWTSTYGKNSGVVRMTDHHQESLPAGVIRLSDLESLPAPDVRRVLAGNEKTAAGCAPGCGHDHSGSRKPSLRRVMPLPVLDDLGPEGTHVYQLAGLVNQFSAGLHGAHMLDIRAQKLLTVVKYMLSIVAQDEEVAGKVRPMALKLARDEVDKMEKEEQQEKGRGARQETVPGAPASSGESEPGNSEGAPSASPASPLAVPPSGMDTASSGSF